MFLLLVLGMGRQVRTEGADLGVEAGVEVPGAQESGKLAIRWVRSLGWLANPSAIPCAIQRRVREELGG
ncbi:hypothetical protein GCM10027157_21230 [Corynebacterium aquatimens]